jgi:type II secretory pathway pseudopilin PulG
MIVVAIIALLAAIAVPNFLRSRKRSQATQVLEDYRLVDSAIDQWAIENNAKAGDVVTWAQVRPFLKTGSRLEASGGKDAFGTAFPAFAVDTIPKVPDATFNALSDVAPATFWAPYR